MHNPKFQVNFSKWIASDQRQKSSSSAGRRTSLLSISLLGSALLSLGLGSLTAWSHGPNGGHPTGGGGGHVGGGGGGGSVGGGGGGFRGGSPPAHSGGSGGTKSAPIHTGGTPVSSPGSAGGTHLPSGTTTPFHANPGVGGAGGVTTHNDFSHSVGIHGGTPAGAPVHAGPAGFQGNHDFRGGAGFEHGGVPGGHPGFGPGGYHDAHYGNMLHSAGPHWNGYHQSYIGNHPVNLAYAGYRPSYYYHPWYHGPWRGYSYGWGWGFGPGIAFGIGGAGWGLSIGTGGYGGYGGYGPYGYAGYPVGWGYGGWGLGRFAYTSGYYPYYNPYYSPVVYQNVVYNYSNPIPVATQTPLMTGNVQPDGTDGTDVPPSDPSFDAAREAFRVGDYDSALANVDSAISRKPTDAVYHEFRALVLFAKRDYRQSAAVLHSLLAVGPGWDWTTMSSLYGDPQGYTGQLRALEQFTIANPQAPEAHFVLGYHYMVGGHKEASAAQLQQVVNLVPNDRLAGELLRMVNGPPQKAATADPGIDPTPSPPPTSPDSPGAPAAPMVDPVDKMLLPGTWKASRSDGSNFVLTMTNDDRFQWKYGTPNQKGEEFGGTYSVDGGVLILQRKEGGALAGAATFSDDRHFVFKLVGAPPDDPGLSFAR